MELRATCRILVRKLYVHIHEMLAFISSELYNPASIRYFIHKSNRHLNKPFNYLKSDRKICIK